MGETANVCKCRHTGLMVLSTVVVIAALWAILRCCCYAGSAPENQPGAVMIEEVTEENFDAKTAEGVTLVQFWCSKCDTCKNQPAEIAEIISFLPEGVVIMQLDIDEYAKCAKQHKIDTVPTWVKFKNGKEVKRVTGKLSKDELKKFICDGEKKVEKGAEKVKEAVKKL